MLRSRRCHDIERVHGFRATLHRHCRPQRRRQDDVRAGIPFRGSRHRPVCQRGSHCRRLVGPETGDRGDDGRARLLSEILRLARARTSFAFEATLSGRVYAGHLKKWKAAGYRIEIMYLKIDSPQLALRRIAARVKQGGHDVPREDVLRRFHRSSANFERIYRSLADRWSVYDNSGPDPLLVERGP
jgi:hypothetical protein